MLFGDSMAKSSNKVKLDISLALEQCHKEMRLKYIGMGSAFILTAGLWSAAVIGFFPESLLWPSVVGIFGVLFLIKAFIQR